jgi:Cytochrome bd terminal oxidase subunit I
MALDPLLLSRLQWAWVIAWHILLPAFTVGLAAYVAVLEGLHLFTGREVYARISAFWIKIFAVSFAMGVVTGIIMPFQFGTNWSRFTDATANMIAPMMAYEGFRPGPGAALGTFFCRTDGLFGHTIFVVLDPCNQQLDADARRVHDHQWAFFSNRLDRDRL